MMALPLVLQVFRRPETIAVLDLRSWDLLIRQARAANLLASLEARLERLGLLAIVPAQPMEHLAWSAQMAQRQQAEVEWEVNHIRKALAAAGTPIVLLKGAAYAKAGLPNAPGRLFSDIDILVPKEKIPAVEAALMLNGWVATHHDEYDQRYYRTWMHELPPMQHVTRRTVIDVHHSILPLTAPYRPDPARLLEAARPLAGDDDFMVLAPADMVLHSAVHLMHEGESHRGMRDLLDLDSLLRHFGSEPNFWTTLVERAQQLQLVRPLFYALRYVSILFHTPVPSESLKSASSAGEPNPVLLALMDRLFMRAFLPVHPSCGDWLTGLARDLLYLRSNWLRMPPLLLARHLFYKAFISRREK